MDKFKLSENFINGYKRKKHLVFKSWELVYMRTYSRIKDDGKNERWWETVQRVVRVLTICKRIRIESHQLRWKGKLKSLLKKCMSEFFQMKFLPPGQV